MRKDSNEINMYIIATIEITLPRDVNRYLQYTRFTLNQRVENMKITTVIKITDNIKKCIKITLLVFGWQLTLNYSMISLKITLQNHRDLGFMSPIPVYFLKKNLLSDTEGCISDNYMTSRYFITITNFDKFLDQLCH